MKIIISDIVSFWIILTGTVLFMDADVLNRYPDGPFLQQQELSDRDVSFFQEGKVCQTQNPLLHMNEAEQHLLEEERPGFKDVESTLWLRNFSSVSVALFREKLIQENFLLFANLVPIWLKVLSLRL